jgi:hypothetical protein
VIVEVGEVVLAHVDQRARLFLDDSLERVDDRRIALKYLRLRTSPSAEEESRIPQRYGSGDHLFFPSCCWIRSAPKCSKRKNRPAFLIHRFGAAVKVFLAAGLQP